MGDETVVEGTGQLASASAVGRSLRSVKSNHILVAIIVALLGGFFLMLDSQFDRLHANVVTLNENFDELATKKDIDEVNKRLLSVEERLLSIEEYLRDGAGSDGRRE